MTENHYETQTPSNDDGGEWEEKEKEIKRKERKSKRIGRGMRMSLKGGREQSET